MQASESRIEIYIVEGGIERLECTVPAASEDWYREFYERKGLGKKIKIVPIYTEEEKAAFAEKARQAREKLTKGNQQQAHQ